MGIVWELFLQGLGENFSFFCFHNEQVKALKSAFIAKKKNELGYVFAIICFVKVFVIKMKLRNNNTFHKLLFFVLAMMVNNLIT